MEKKYVVYCHELYDGRKYFGITCQKPNGRWREGKGYKSGYFVNAIKKYGWEAFEHKILHIDLSKSEATKLEKEYIAKYKTQDKKYGFNLTSGGDGGCDPTDEVREKMRKAKQGNKIHLGYKCSDEAKKKMSDAKKGKHPWNYGKHGYKMPPHSEASKQKMSATMKNIWENKRNDKKCSMV